MQAISLHQDGDVTVATLRHPTSPMNAVDELLHDELAELCNMLRRDPGGRAVLLTGEGKAFSAGGDFDWFPTLRDPAALPALHRAAKQMIWDLLDIDVPVVCGLNGAAAGLGASIALLTDVIVMSERAVIVETPDKPPARFEWRKISHRVTRAGAVVAGVLGRTRAADIAFVSPPCAGWWPMG